jgi:hypothetical protein
MACTTRSETGQRRISEAHGAEQVAQAVPTANIPQRQRHPAHPKATAVTAQILTAYRIKDEKTLRTREHQEAFQAWAWSWDAN